MSRTRGRAVDVLAAFGSGSLLKRRLGELIVGLYWKVLLRTWRRLLMLSSMKRWGSVVSGVSCGKLYLGVVVIVYCSITGFTNMQYLIGGIFKYCACASCTIQYTIGAVIDTKPAKTTNQSQNENRRHRIRNRIPRRPNPNRSRPHTLNCHRPPQRLPTSNVPA